MLHWDETDLIECLEVLPETDSYTTKHRFIVCQDGLRLVLTLWTYDGDVEFLLYRDGVEQPVFELKLLDCPKIRYVRNPKRSEYYQEYLEFETSHCGKSRFDSSPIDRGVRLSVKPHFNVQLF